MRPGALLIVGHTNLDRILRVDEFPPEDRTVPITAQKVLLGGTAANIARTAAAWGVEVGILSRVGGDFPTEFVDRLRREGVDVRGLERVPSEFSPTCFILEEASGQHRTLIDQGPMRDGTRPRIPKGLIASYDWIHLTTGSPEYQLAVLRHARSLGLRVAADPAQEVQYRWSPSQLRKLVEGSEILFGNRAEIHKVRSLLKVASDDALTELVPLVVITDGSKGAVAISRDGLTRVRATRPHRPKTHIGAGDAFRGGFYAAWFSGQPLGHCLSAGVRSASAWMEAGGPPSPRASTTPLYPDPRGKGRR
jgi:nucleoside kinase